jgi:hypothetical protein
MTPSEIEAMARNRYNAISDTFWNQQEIFDYIYAACLEAADETLAIERTYTTTTVAGTQEYDFPTNSVGIKRVTYDGKKLTKIDMIEDDILTGLNQATTAQGSPECYFIWNNVISLRPVPDAAATLKLWTYNQPSAITVSSTLEIPSQFHARLVNYVMSMMAAKDSNYNAATYYMKMWERDLVEIRKSVRKMKRTDKFTTVKDENMIVETSIGGT